MCQCHIREEKWTNNTKAKKYEDGFYLETPNSTTKSSYKQFR